MRRLAALLLLGLAACTADPIESARLRPSKMAMEQMPVNTALFQNVAIGQISLPLDAVEEATAGNITESAFRDALQTALLDSAMLARVGTPGFWRLDARMTSFERPGWGFTFEVPSTVEYTLTRQADGFVAFRQTVQATGEGGFGDAFFSGIERRRAAMSNSVKANIVKAIGILSSTPLGAPIVPRQPSPPVAPGNPALPRELPPG